MPDNPKTHQQQTNGTDSQQELYTKLPMQQPNTRQQDYVPAILKQQRKSMPDNPKTHQQQTNRTDSKQELFEVLPIQQPKPLPNHSNHKEWYEEMDSLLQARGTSYYDLSLQADTMSYFEDVCGINGYQ